MRKLTLAALLVSSAAFAGEPANQRLNDIVSEARSSVGKIHQALSEVASGGSYDETCFRVGGLHMTLRNELQEFLNDAPALEPQQNAVAKRLIEDAKSLPSFCGDRETVESDPGYEQVGKGDVADLMRELGNIDCRLKVLEGAQPLASCQK